jgi:hypothetical protein
MGDFELLGPISDVRVIAQGKKVRIRKRLNQRFGYCARWRKMKGKALIRVSGEVLWAEIHRYECHGKGRFAYKFKRQIERE